MKKHLLLILIAVQFLSVAAQADTNKSFNVRFFGYAKQFQWTEYLYGSRLLKESGLLYGLGGDVAAQLSAPLWIEFRGEVFFGDVDYDGALQTLDGQLIPYESDTAYAGIKVEVLTSLRHLVTADFNLKPYAGLGLLAWRRTLDTRATDRSIGRWGYIEDWYTAYVIIGLGAGVAISPNGILFAQIEGRYPIKNSMKADFKNVGGPPDVKLKPGKRASIYAEAGVNVTPFMVAAFYETLDFSESDIDRKYNIAFQPESKAAMFGLKLGVSF